MLSFLRIENLAIIDSLSVDFGPGLNVLTGETGAGKSIIADAVGLLLGARGGAELVRTGCPRLAVEGLFEIADRPDLGRKLEAWGIDPGEEGLIIKREITSTGRSRAFVNGTLVPLAQLRETGEALADLHGQHQHQSLLRSDGQREALDRYAGAGEAAGKVADAAARLRALMAERDSLNEKGRELARREEILRSEIADIEGVAPAAEEHEELRREEALLRNAEEVQLLAAETCEILNEDDASVLSRLGTAAGRLARLAEIDDRCSAALRALEEAKLDVQEALREVEPYREPADFEPRRLEEVAARLAALERLRRRYGPALEDVLRYLEESRRELESLGSLSERLSRIDGEIVEAAGGYSETAAALSRLRREGAGSLKSRMRKELKAVAMEGCLFEVAFEEHLDPGSPARVGGRPIAVRPTGAESVEFLISPNPGEDLRALAKIASGGELSRLMLALRAASEERSDQRTLIFDEVDAGIGGGVAEAVGKRLKDLSRRQQVLCVTHLPQIAALADRHLRVAKEASGGRTRATAVALEGAGRVEELARMIGSPGAPTAKKHAAALISGRKEP